MKICAITRIATWDDKHEGTSTLYPERYGKRKNLSYYCSKQTDFTIKIKNTQNVHTFEKMYFDNGEIVPPDWMSGSKYNFEFKEFVQVFKDVLTTEELNH